MRRKASGALPKKGASLTPDSRALVYFLGSSDERQIKIGSTSDFPKRLKTHVDEAEVYGAGWTVLAAVNGNKTNESSVRSHFAAFRRLVAKREYFEPALELVGYIGWLRDQWYCTTGDEWTEPPTRVPAVSWALWKPEPTRTKLIAQSTLPFEPWRATLGPREITADDYYTPAHLIQAVRDVMGDIDLDPASHPLANKVVRASRFFQKSEDGLRQRWSGRVWLNPPFSEWQSFGEKLCREIDNISEACVLVSAPTITAAYFEPLLRRTSCVCVLTGRLVFWGPQVEDGRGAGAPSGHLALYYGETERRFSAVFNRLGVCFRPAEVDP